jgi:hypothetical protein
MIKYGKTGVHERAALISQLVVVHLRLLKQNSDEGQLLAGAINGIIDLIVSGDHLDIVKPEFVDKLTEVEVSTMISGMYDSRLNETN